MGLIIEKQNGKVFDLEAMGIREVEYLVINSPDVEHEYFEVDGMDGLVDGEAYLKGRSLTASLIALTDYVPKMINKRHEIFELFDARQPFYLWQSEDPSKRWFVRCTSPFSITEAAATGTFSVEFKSASPYAETPIVYSRRFREPTFMYKNEGQRIDMKAQEDTEIEFKGASTDLTITNETTGDVWKYNGTTEASDIILLKGVRSFKNSNSIFGQTNRRLLNFDSGWNNFSVTGADADFELIIRTRYYFL